MAIFHPLKSFKDRFLNLFVNWIDYYVLMIIKHNRSILISISLRWYSFNSVQILLYQIIRAGSLIEKILQPLSLNTWQYFQFLSALFLKIQLRAANYSPDYKLPLPLLFQLSSLNATLFSLFFNNEDTL